MGVSKIWGYLFGVPIIRTIIRWGLPWGIFFGETTIYRLRAPEKQEPEEDKALDSADALREEPIQLEEGDVGQVEDTPSHCLEFSGFLGFGLMGVRA